MKKFLHIFGLAVVFVILPMVPITTQQMTTDDPGQQVISLPPGHPLSPYTIDGLRSRDYPGGEIEVLSVLENNSEYTRYYIAYPSDDLTITGVMNVPVGEGPFPVLVMLHGYYDRAGYWSGLGTSNSAAFFARQGYLTVAPDFRTWGESDMGGNLFATGLVIDTLNLISSLPSLSQADATRIAIWGHSMGGGVATKALLVDPRIRAGILYAPNSADDIDLINRWGAACRPGQSQSAGARCNPAEVLPPDATDTLEQVYYQAAFDPVVMQQIAPIFHLQYLTAPVQIHIGTADGAQLSQTPPEWSEKLYMALSSAGKEAEYYTYPGQGHFIEGNSYVTMMQRTLDFLLEALQ